MVHFQVPADRRSEDRLAVFVISAYTSMTGLTERLTLAVAYTTKRADETALHINSRRNSTIRLRRLGQRSRGTALSEGIFSKSHARRSYRVVRFAGRAST
jgi:hypothetical protein